MKYPAKDQVSQAILHGSLALGDRPRHDHVAPDLVLHWVIVAGDTFGPGSYPREPPPPPMPLDLGTKPERFCLGSDIVRGHRLPFSLNSEITSRKGAITNFSTLDLFFRRLTSIELQLAIPERLVAPPAASTRSNPLVNSTKCRRRVHRCIKKFLVFHLNTCPP